MSSRRRSAAWLLVPVLLSVGVIGTRKWSKHDPLVAAVGAPVPQSKSGVADSSTSDPVRTRLQDASWSASAEARMPPGSRDIRGIAHLGGEVIQHPPPAAEAEGAGLLQETHFEGMVGELNETAMARDNRAAPVQLAAGAHLVVRGAPEVPPDFVGLAEHLGPGPWELDMRYRGLIVIRKEEP